MRYVVVPLGLGLGLGANAYVARANTQCYKLQASGGASGVLGQLFDGQNRVGGGLPTGCYCLDGSGGFTDSQGRGCILTPPTTQFQCDVGASPTNGFAVSSSGSVTYNGSGTFYACPVNDNGEYNVYTTPAPGQTKCVEISLGSAGSCGAGASQPVGSQPASKPIAKPSQPAPKPSAPIPSAPGYKPSGPAPSVPGPKPSAPGPKPSAPAPAPSAPASKPSVPSPSMPAPKPSAPAPESECVPSVVTVTVTQSAVPVMTQPAPPASKPAPPPAPPASKPANPPSPPASKPVPPPAPQTSKPAATQPAPSSPAASAPSKPTAPGTCPQDLNGNYQYPHLIVPVDSQQPSKAYGTSYNGTINSHTCTIFNFDIPASYAGMSCSTIFLLPKKAELETSSYSISGQGQCTVSTLKGNANAQTSWSNAPAKSDDVASFELSPGNSYTVESGACQAGKTVTYKICSSGDFSINYFQDYNPSPVGLYVRQC